MYKREELVNIINQSAGLQLDIKFDDKLMKYGIDSITVMKIVGKFRKEGYRVKFADLMEHPTVNQWYELLQAHAQKETKTSESFKENLDDSEMFDLTDVQYAYWVGRDDEQIMGGVDCHAYYEFKGKDIDVSKLKEAWNVMACKHKALRTAFKDGKQFVKKEAYKDTFIVKDFSKLTKDEAQENILKVREELSHRKFNLEDGEVAGLTICLLPENEHLLCMDFALIVADVKSIQIMLRDLAAIYTGKDIDKTTVEWNFRKYNDFMNKSRVEEKKEAVKYWQEKSKSMPMAPMLPLEKKQEDIKRIKNTHYTNIIDAGDWEKFVKKAGNVGVTPPMVLLTAYAEVINRWSNNDKFLINVPLFDRAQEYEGITDAVGDFTTLLLTSHDFSRKISFSERVKCTQDNFIKDMHYAACSGVEVQRMLQQNYPEERSFAPVVFACNIGLDFIDDVFDKSLGSIHYMVSQTPQVWIDCQMFERNKELHISWDVCDELFPENMPQDMFDTYVGYIRELSKADSDWNNILGVKNIPDCIRKTVEETVAEYPKNPGLLTDGLVKHAIQKGDAIALYDIANDREVSYKELYQRSMELAIRLKEEGVNPKEKIAIRIPRGINQVVAIYGVLLAGCTYVPVSYNQPDIRFEKIMKSMNISFVIANDDSKNVNENYRVISVPKENQIEYDPMDYKAEIASDSVAYVIMTSGSTGEPKGVEITHESAFNTISDVNERNEIGDSDNFLAVSAIDFDLSVYDIFGSAMAGACLNVLSEENAKDAECWFENIVKRNIKVWNSVPILFDMVLTVAEHKKEVMPLKRVMLSGDWVSASLAKRLYKILPETVLVAMGGATEASIWSNECIVPREVPSNWKFIPYGQALKGQIYRIIDKNGNDCPDYVTGELYIGGYGVAKDYFGDEEKTSAKFTSDMGIRWYHTGDSGRFWKDGTIEFLGRLDNQVKVKGHRIELGEIEAAAVTDSFATLAVAIVVQDEDKKQIILYYTGDNEVEEEKAINELNKRLPSYMVPKRCIYLKEMPVTANGKINRKELLKIKIIPKESSTEDSFETDTERVLAAIWKELLKVKEVKRDDDYFELGGNSLNATKAIYQIQEKFGVKLKISQIFKHPSLYAMAKEIDTLAKGVAG